MNSDIGNREILWRQYSCHIDLYKFYIDATIKINVFYYAITGAILSFYFTRSEIRMARWSLMLPAVLSIGLAFLFIYGARIIYITRDDVFAIRDALGLKSAPEFNILKNLLYIFASIQLLTMCSLTYLMLFCAV